MTNQNKSKHKVIQVLLGILSSALLWSAGLLMSGNLVGGDILEFHEAGFLSFIFPPLFFGACVLLAVYSAKRKKDAYFKTTLICLSIPIIAYYGLAVPFDAFAAPPFVMFVIFPSMPPAGVLGGIYECLDKTGLSDIMVYVMSILLNIIPMLAGLVSSIIIYKKAKKNGGTD